MTDNEQKALVKRLRIIPDQNGLMCEDYEDVKQAADLIEQHEAFKQEVSDALVMYSPENRNPALGRFIITKPDPLVEVLKDFGGFMPDAEDFRAALEARGLEIRSKNDDR